MSPRFFLLGLLLSLACHVGRAGDYNSLVLDAVGKMPEGGTYARYRQEREESRRFEDLYRTVSRLQRAISVDRKGRLKVKPEEAKPYSFCSSATYLLFCQVLETLQEKGAMPTNADLNAEIGNIGEESDVIHGRLDGIGIFGHWNADGPGTAVLFERLNLGRNFSRFENARPGDFMKIFWNDSIGKGESGHLVVYLGQDSDRGRVRVWSSNMQNENGTSGYGTMWIAKERIQRVVFSRLEQPENLAAWLSFSPEQKKSEYLIRIRSTGSSGEELRKVTNIVD